MRNGKFTDLGPMFKMADNCRQWNLFLKKNSNNNTKTNDAFMMNVASKT